MPPNNKEIAVKLDYNNQDALPFNQPVYERKGGQVAANVYGGSCPQPGTSQNNDLELNEEASDVRITTRARYTYELDRYNKNAMLIIDNKSPIQEDDTARTLADTFAKYRFEVEILNNLPRDEIIGACERFFNRDFTEYGCIGIAILAVVNGFERGGFMADDTSYKASEVLKHITSHLPPTLRDKPKIYINETNSNNTHIDWVPTHNDILTFNIPLCFLSPITAQPTESSPGPLHVLCRNIIQRGDKEDLITIMENSIQDILNYNYYTTIFEQYPIRIASTLVKELLLTK